MLITQPDKGKGPLCQAGIQGERMPYKAPLDEYHFLFDHIVGFSKVTQTDRFTETTPDLVSAILGEAGKLCEEVLAPVQRAGDQHPAVLENASCGHHLAMLRPITPSRKGMGFYRSRSRLRRYGASHDADHCRQ